MKDNLERLSPRFRYCYLLLSSEQSTETSFGAEFEQGIARPTRVTAAGSSGVASGLFEIDTEDTITLLVEWENLEDGSK